MRVGAWCEEGTKKPQAPGPSSFCPDTFNLASPSRGQEQAPLFLVSGVGRVGP